MNKTMTLSIDSPYLEARRDAGDPLPHVGGASLPVAKDMHARIDLRGKAPESLNSTDAGKSVARLLSGSGTLDKRGRKVASTSDVGRQETSRNELERNNMKANHRVRERKSREKSLLAGAMVGGVMLSDEHQERRRLQIRALIALGKERG